MKLPVSASQSPSKMTADKSILPGWHRIRTSGRVSSAQPEHYSSHLAVATMSIPWKSEANSQSNFASYRNQSIPEVGNGLYVITVNDGGQISHQLGIQQGSEQP